MKTSPSLWKKWLKITLAKASARNNPPRLAVMGIGNELNGDDAAGVLTARLLRGQIENRLDLKGRAIHADDSSFSTPNCLVIVAGLAPENFTGVLRRFRPDFILLLDAAQLGKEPGHVVVIDVDLAGGFGASTHLQPLATLAIFLRAELDCEIGLLGIQPAHLNFGEPVSAPVNKACGEIAAELARILTTFDKSTPGWR
jgi:hydrogenase 3 maturation protease